MHGMIQLRPTPNETYQPWVPGVSNPEDHPMWEAQVNLELEMVQRGAEKYRTKVAEARDKMEMTSVPAFQRRMDEMVLAMARYLKAWLTKVKQTRGASPLAYRQVKDMDPNVVCFITIRTLLDVITLGNPGLTSMGRKIGTEIEYQARMEAWRSKAPDVFYGVQNEQRHATALHRRRVNINRFNKLMREPLNWIDWTDDVRLHTGLRMIDIAIQATGAFEVADETQAASYFRKVGAGQRVVGAARRHQAKGATRRTYKTPQYIIKLAPDILQALMKQVDREEMLQPQYMPCLMPPKRWSTMRDGGYYTPIIPRPPLIRFSANSPDQRRHALEEYNALDMPRVMAALHTLQETPWRVNSKVFAVALSAWDRGLPIAGLPTQEALPLPERPEGFDAAAALCKSYEVALQRLKDRDAIKQARERWPAEVEEASRLVRAWKAAAAKVYGENATRASKTRQVRTTIEMAVKFKDLEFYFPHMLDFRGRMYPIATFLQPQGNDLARGLLTFAKGLPVGEQGGEWLAIHLANHFGADKMSYEGRIKWVRDNEEVWRTIAADPIRNRNLWLPETGIKHHWQGLAAVYEWVRFLDEGPSMVSSLPIHIDGTCNGIQHLSAMMRDEVGGRAVNLIPSDTPNDIYADVARKLQARLEGIADAGGKQGEIARLWLEVFGGEVPRSLTKAPTMTTPYGATRSAFFGQIYDWLAEHLEAKGRLPFSPVPERSHELKGELVPWLATHIIDSLDGIVDRGKVCMKWLQSAAKAVADVNEPIIWKTPSGFVVRHFYAQEKEAKTSTLVDGKRLSLSVPRKVEKLAVKEQLQGIAPNFTHSMDASANMETIISMALDPRSLPITAIHDAYGTCAGAMWTLFDAVRHAFIKVHDNDVLEDFRQCCVRMLRDHLRATRHDLDFAAASEIAEDTVERVPERGELDVRGVAQSDYFFA